MRFCSAKPIFALEFHNLYYNYCAIVPVAVLWHIFAVPPNKVYVLEFFFMGFFYLDFETKKFNYFVYFLRHHILAMNFGFFEVQQHLVYS